MGDRLLATLPAPCHVGSNGLTVPRWMDTWPRLLIPTTAQLASGAGELLPQGSDLAQMVGVVLDLVFGGPGNADVAPLRVRAHPLPGLGRQRAEDGHRLGAEPLELLVKLFLRH